MTTKHFEFEVIGGFEIDASFEPIRNAWGEISGFRLPDGREVQLVIGLEVFKPSKKVNDCTIKEYTTIVAENEMDELGFECLDYNHCTFEYLPTVELKDVIEQRDKYFNEQNRVIESNQTQVGND